MSTPARPASSGFSMSTKGCSAFTGFITSTTSGVSEELKKPFEDGNRLNAERAAKIKKYRRRGV